MQVSRTRGQRNLAVAVKVSSDASENKKSPRKVSRDERRSLVESFVNKYRAMNSGNFPATKAVQKEVGGSYYLIRYIVSELQYKSQIPSTSTRNDTTLDAELHENDDVNLEKIDAIKNSEVTSKEEDGRTSSLEETTLSVEIAAMSTMTSDTTLSLKKHKLSIIKGDGQSSSMDEKISSTKTTSRALGASVGVKKAELVAQEANEPTSAVDYETLSEEIAKPSLNDDNSPETANGRYVLKEEAKDFYSPTRISENNIREQTASKDVQQQQLSDLENVTRDLPEEHEKKPFRWNLKALANGFMNIWRKL